MYALVHDDELPICDLRDTTYMNGCLPVISRVCHEAREIVLKNGWIPTFEGQPPDAQWDINSNWDIQDLWRDDKRDSPHMNWVESHTVEWSRDGEEPLRYLEWEASRMCGTPSFRIELLDEGCRGPDWDPVHLFGVNTWFSDERVAKDIETFRRRPSWRVVMRTIVVHAEFERAAKTGLFGLLGDAPVQLVDAADRERIEAFFDLAKACQSEIPEGTRITKLQDLQPLDSEEKMKESLKDVIIVKYRNESLAKLMRPVIMVRLCLSKCYDRAECPQARRDTADREFRARANYRRGSGRVRRGLRRSP